MNMNGNKVKKITASRSTQVDIQECIKHSSGNIFELAIAAAGLAREISLQQRATGNHEHTSSGVTALLEFQAGKSSKEYIKKMFD